MSNTSQESYLPVVTDVAVVGDRVLRLLFSDDTAGDAGFARTSRRQVKSWVLAKPYRSATSPTDSA